MKTCKCGSFAINIDPKKKECDVCYYKNRLFEILAVLNRDGGHYLNEFGIDAAIENGIENFYKVIDDE